MAQRAVDNAALITTVSTLTRAANTAQFSPWPAQDLTDIDVPLNQLYRRISNKMPTFPNALFISSSNIRTPLRLRGNSSNGQPDTVGPTPPTEQTPPPQSAPPPPGGEPRAPRHQSASSRTTTRTLYPPYKTGQFWILQGTSTSPGGIFQLRPPPQGTHTQAQEVSMEKWIVTGRDAATGVSHSLAI